MRRGPFAKAGRMLASVFAATAMVAASLAVAAAPAHSAVDGGAMVGGGCLTNPTPAADDVSFEVPLGFTLNLWGTDYSSAWASSNGFLSFGGWYLEFDPGYLRAAPLPLIAPFFYDGDSAVGGGKAFTVGYTTWEGRHAFCMSYDGVDWRHQPGHPDYRAHFQVLLVDRSDIGLRDFDIVFNYDELPSGIYSSAGYTKPGAAESYVMPGSSYISPGWSTDLSDDGDHALVHNSFGSDVKGRYIFPVRGGYPLSPELIELGTTGPEAPFEVLGTHRSVLVGSSFEVDVDTDSSGELHLSSRTPSVCTTDGTTVSALQTGACRITVEVEADGTWGPAGRTVTYTVAPTAQTVDFPELGETTIGNPVPLEATASSGMPITYVSLTPELCEIDGATAVPLAPGECQILAEQPGDAVYAGAQATATLTINGLTVDVTVMDAPSSVVAGGTLVFDLLLVASDAIRYPYVSGMVVTVGGVELPALLSGSFPTIGYAFVRPLVELDERVAPGTHTVDISFPAWGDLEATSVSFPLEVEASSSTLAVSGPAQVTWGDQIEIVAELDTDAGLPIDGTLSVLDADDDELVSVPAAAGPVALEVAGLDVGEHTLRVVHTGATFYDDSDATISVEVIPVDVTVEVTVDQLIAGLPTKLTASTQPDQPGLTGTVELYVDGEKVAEGAASNGGSISATITRPAGPLNVRAAYLPGSTAFAAAEKATTFAMEASATAVWIDPVYTPPTTADSTGSIEGRVCVEVPVGVELFALGSEITVTLQNHSTGTTRAERVVVDEEGDCLGQGLSVSGLEPGEYALDAVFDGNGYLEPSSYTHGATVTVAQAPTEIDLDVHGEVGAVYGARTTLRATLSDPVPGFAHTGQVVFMAGGVELASAGVVGGIATANVLLPAGDDIEVTARYVGDAVHAAVVSDPLAFDIAQGTATIDVQVTPARVVLGQPSTLKATVTVATPDVSPAGSTAGFVSFGAGRPGSLSPLLSGFGTLTPAAVGDGTVTFYVNGVPVGTRPLVGGVASMTYVLPAGFNTITATFSGNANVVPVVLGAAADVDVVVEQGTGLPTGSESDDERSGVPAAARGAGTGRLPRTGTDAQTLVCFAALLTVVGAVLCRVGRPRHN